MGIVRILYRAYIHYVQYCWSFLPLNCLLEELTTNHTRGNDSRNWCIIQLLFVVAECVKEPRMASARPSAAGAGGEREEPAATPPTSAWCTSTSVGRSGKPQLMEVDNAELPKETKTYKKFNNT